MINRRCRRCYCINNYNSCRDKNMIDKTCENVIPIEQFTQNCECGFDDDELNVFPENPMLAQSYVPIQYMDETFKPCIGLRNGTIFPELVSSYNPGDSMREIEFLRNTNTIGGGCNANGGR